LKLITSIYHTIRFWTLIILLTLVLGAVATIGGIFDGSGNFSHNIARLWSRLICRLNGIKVEIIGLENIPSDKAQVFIANHQSYFDIFALSGYLPVQIRWMAKSILFKIPLFGFAMKSAGYISVNRENRKKAYESFLKAIEKLNTGSSIVIFPEGTRSLDYKVAEFKKGGHLLAMRSQKPMVPVTIIGTGRIIKKGSGVINPGPVKIIISPAIEAANISSKEGETALNNIREIISQNYSKYSDS
jgi:1-acyl-sn-glycerol-3-phosphate acyltransferase